MSKAIQLVETPPRGGILGGRPGYDVLLDGKKVGDLFFNLRGYTGCCLPQASGVPLEVGERSIRFYRRVVAQLNREFADARQRASDAVSQPQRN